MYTKDTPIKIYLIIFKCSAVHLPYLKKKKKLRQQFVHTLFAVACKNIAASLLQHASASEEYVTDDVRGNARYTQTFQFIAKPA